MAKIWSCKIGESDSVPWGADGPMRNAVRTTYLAITGNEPQFIFSGWIAELTEPERAVVENRLPKEEPQTSDSHAFKNFHRALCERFGYMHDEVDWRRDQVSLIEHIAKRVGGK